MKIDTTSATNATNTTNSSDTSAKAKAKRLKVARELTYLGLTAFAKKHDFNYGTLKSWELGLHGGLPSKRALDIVRALQIEGIVCSYEWLIHGIGEAPYRGRVDLVANQFTLGRVGTSVGSGADAETDSKICIASASYETAAVRVSQSRNEKSKDNQGISEEQRILRELEDFCQHYQDVAYLTVDDDGLHPTFQHGDLVAGVKYYGKDIKKAANLDCIVQVVGEGGGAGQLLRHVIYSGSTKDKYTLICKNHDTTVAKAVLYDVQLISAAPVVWLRRKVR